MTTQDHLVNLNFFKESIKRFLPNSQAVSLAVILIVSFVLIYSLSSILMPVFASVVLAYLLEGLVEKAVRAHLPRLPAVFLVFSGFMACLGFVLFYLMPLVSQQAVELIQHIPEIISRAQTGIMRLPQMYPKLISETRIQQMMFAVQRELLTYGQNVLSLSAASVMGIVSALIYLFLVPMMVFFFLKDKELLISWFLQFMPRDRNLTVRVWEEVNVQIGNYVRGKFAEIFILWFVSYATFTTMGLNYAMLLSVLMGVQVIIPYVGATLVTFPVLGVAYFQWGWSGDDFMYIVIAYSIIQALDGVVLVPVLFSEAVNLHAIAIVVAILFFGGMWGFWGVFFAIPLATVVKAVLTAWPRIGDQDLNAGVIDMEPRHKLQG
ncbi:MAG: AI-2E family transporter [Methylococcales bacterium]|nr:AI-2E family transporter [Methylococcales bacterium]